MRMTLQNHQAKAVIDGALSPQDIEHYWREGYVVARGIFQPREIQDLRAGCDELCDLARHMTQDTYQGVTYFNLLRACDPFDPNILSVPQIPGMLRRVTYPYHVSAIFDAYRQHPRLLGTIMQLLGGDLVQLVNQVNFNPPGMGTGWGWHQDYRFRRKGLKDFVKGFVQCLTAIDHSSAANGGVRMVPRSFLLGPMKLDQEGDRAESYFDATQAVTPSLEPGDAVLFNAYMVHGSTANRSNAQRRVYINGYAAQSQCSHGIPVLIGKELVPERMGFMEFESDLEKLPLAAKY